MWFVGLKRFGRSASFRLSFFSFCCFSLLFGVLLIGVYQMSAYVLQENLRDRLHNLILLVEPLLDDEDWLIDDFEEQFQQSAVSYVLWDRDGDEVVSTVGRFQLQSVDDQGFITIEREDEEHSPNEAQAGSQQAGTALPSSLAKPPWQYEDWFEDEHLVMVELATGEGGRLWLGFGTDDNDTLLSILRSTLVVSWLIMLLVGALLSYLISKRTLHRIERINQTCLHIRKGNLNQRIAVTSAMDEFDQLGDNFNAMLQHIQRLIEDIRRVSDQIAHDLRTPLTRLQGKISALCLAPDSTELRFSTQEEIDTVIRTFNALLRVSRLEAGATQLEFTQFDLTTMLTDLIELYQPLLEEEGGCLEYQLPAEPLLVQGDPDLWCQALSNLLDNACKYSQGQKRVNISLIAGDTPRILIEDNGAGVPESAYEKITSRFYRLPQHQQQAGFGLGLSMVKAICQAHNAELQFARSELGGLKVSIIYGVATGLACNKLSEIHT